MNPISPKPTYLNYRANLNPVGLPSASRSVSSPTTSASAPMLHRLPSANSTSSNPSGSSVIVYVPLIASPSLNQHLSVLLSTQRIVAVHLIGARDVVLKNLRTDIYTLAGRMRSDVQVSISLTDGPKTLQKALKDIGNRGQKVLGALVCECHDQPQGSDHDTDILAIDTDDVEAMWKASVLPLHTLLRSLLPLFSQTTTPSSPPAAAPFIYLDTSLNLSTFAAASRAALLSSLASSPATKDFIIGPASDHLIPAPVVSETQSMRSLKIDTNHGAANGYAAGSPETSPLFGAESPTKLWAVWAAQYE